MSRIETTMLVHRPLSEVWGFFADLHRYSLVVFGEPFRTTTPGALEVGSRIKDAEGVVGTIVDLEPMRRLAVEFNSPRRVTLRRVRLGHVLEPLPEGTRITSWVELEFKGVGKIVRPLLLIYFRDNVRQGVDSIKNNLEARSLLGDEERVARPARYSNLIAAGAGGVMWLALLVTNGPVFALQTIWILLLAAFVLAYTVVPRLRFSHSRLRRTFGPWSREVDLSQLESIRWKDNTYGYGAQGTIYVCDRSGHRVAIQVGAFKRVEEWAPLLLQAATASGAKVDRDSREILER